MPLAEVGKSDKHTTKFSDAEIIKLKGILSVLKINNFGCERKEITIEIHESGNELFIKREVYAEGKFKDLVCRIRLPVQVVEGQVSCKFNPNEKSGQLSLKISNQSPSEFVGRYEICEFPLEADEHATEDNMELNINQTDDFFCF